MGQADGRANTGNDLRRSKRARLHNRTFTSNQRDRILVTQGSPENSRGLASGGDPSNASWFGTTELPIVTSQDQGNRILFIRPKMLKIDVFERDFELFCNGQQ